MKDRDNFNNEIAERGDFFNNLKNAVQEKTSAFRLKLKSLLQEDKEYIEIDGEIGRGESDKVVEGADFKRGLSQDTQEYSHIDIDNDVKEYEIGSARGFRSPSFENFDINNEAFKAAQIYNKIEENNFSRNYNYPDLDYEDYEENYAVKSNRVIIKIIYTVLIIILLLLLVFKSASCLKNTVTDFTSGLREQPYTMIVGSYVGEFLDDVRTELVQSYGETLVLQGVYSHTEPKGMIISQSPSFGTKIYANPHLSLTYSLGSPPPTGKSLQGLTLDEARDRLLDFEYIVEYRTNSLLPNNTVIELFEKDGQLTLVVSEGGEDSPLVLLQKRVPRLTGKSYIEAKRLLDNTGLTYEFINIHMDGTGNYSPVEEANRIVFYQDAPAGKEYKTGDKINVYYGQVGDKYMGTPEDTTYLHFLDEEN